MLTNFVIWLDAVASEDVKINVSLLVYTTTHLSYIVQCIGLSNMHLILTFKLHEAPSSEIQNWDCKLG